MINKKLKHQNVNIVLRMSTFSLNGKACNIVMTTEIIHCVAHEIKDYTITCMYENNNIRTVE